MVLTFLPGLTKKCGSYNIVSKPSPLEDPMATKQQNERPFRHQGPNGSELRAERCDFIGVTTLTIPRRLSKKELAQDVAAIIGYHAAIIFPEFPPGTPFSGYDSVLQNLTIVEI